MLKRGSLNFRPMEIVLQHERKLERDVIFTVFDVIFMVFFECLAVNAALLLVRPVQ